MPDKPSDARRLELQTSLRAHWNKAEELQAVIRAHLGKGFGPELLPAALRAQTLAPTSADATCLHANVLAELGQLEEAETLLRKFGEKEGENGRVLANLAMLYSKAGREAVAEKVLWRALECDPNYERAITWFASMQKERRGDEGYRDAFDKISRLNGAWRAQFWLARFALEAQNLSTSLHIYRAALAKVKVLPTDALEQIIGDLVRFGFEREMSPFCLPLYAPKHHGLTPGLTLIAGFLAGGDAKHAAKVLLQLDALKRQDWRKELAKWDEKIRAFLKPVATSAAAAEPGSAFRFRLHRVERPVWVGEGSHLITALPSREPSSLRVGFLAGSLRIAGQAPQNAQPPSGGKTRPPLSAAVFARAFPLFLAEQLALSSTGRSLFLLPRQEEGAIHTSDARFDAEVLKIVSPRPELLLLLHVDAGTSEWRALFELLDGSSGKSLEIWESFLPATNPASALGGVVDDTFRHLFQRAKAIKPDPVATGALPSPKAARLPLYLSALDQLLQLSLALHEPESERELLGFFANVALDEPASARARFLLVSALELVAATRPEIALELRIRAHQLQREFPLAAKPHAIISEVLKRTFTN